MAASANCGNINSAFTAPATSFCGPGAVTLNFTNTSTGAGAAAATYSWYLNNVPFDTTSGLAAPNPSPVISAVGTYTFMVVADGSTCLDTATVLVTIFPAPNASFTFTPNNQCAGNPVSFTNTSTGTTGSSTYSWNFGDAGTSTQQNPTHTYAAGGTYTVTLTVTNFPGCTSTYTAAVTALAIPFVSIAGDDGDGDTQYCLLPGDPTTQETVTFSNFTTGAVSYTWNFGDASAPVTTASNAPLTHTYTNYGTYTVTMTATGPNGCTATATLTVIFEHYVGASFSVPITEMSGCLPLTIHPVNASQNATTYTWNFGDNTPPVTTTSFTPPAHTYTVAGTYTITLVAANSCNSAQSTVSPIIVVGAPVVNFSANPMLGCSPQVVTFQNLSTGVSPANNYNWNFGNGNIVIGTGNPPPQTYTQGSWTVTLIAGSACGTDTIQRVIVVDTIPDVNLTVTPTVGCTPLTVTTTNTSTGGNLSYQWYIDNGFFSSAANIPPHAFTAPPGNNPVTHSIHLYVSNHCGTRDSLVNIVVHPAVQAIFTPLSSTICQGGSVTFTQSSYGDNLTYAWDFGNGNTATTAGPHTQTYNLPGTYTVSLIVNGFCGADTLTGTVVVNPLPVAAFTPVNPTGCEDLVVNFTNNSTTGGTYSWNFGGAGATPATSAAYTPPAVTFPTPGTQTVTLTVTVLGCVNTATTTVTILPRPVPSFTLAPVSGCSPLSVTFNNTTAATAGNVYSWDFGNSNTSGAQNPPGQIYTTVLNDTVYTIELLVTNNGCVDSITQTVTVHPDPVASFTMSADTVCALDNIIFTNTSTGVSVYSWDFGDASTSATTNPVHAYSGAGSYIVQLIATTAFGCRDTITAPVMVDSIPTAAFTSTIECVGDTTFFTNSTTGSVATWAWNFGDATASSQQTPDHLYAGPGTYNVTLTATNFAGCSNFVTQPVIVNSVPVAAFTSSTACAGQPTAFTDQTNGTPVSWNWDFGDASPAGNTQNPSHTYASAGTYNTTLIVAAGSGCSDTITGSVTVNPVPTAAFSFVSACANDSVFFTSTSLGGPTTFTWNFGDATTDNTNNPAPSHVYAAGGTYNVTLTAGYGTGCTNSIVIPVTVYPRTVPSFTANSPCLGAATNFTDATTNSPNSWQWNFGDASPAGSAQNPSHSYASAGTYAVTLITSNSFGCVDSIVTNVVVRPLPVADFTTDTACAGMPSQFTDLSASAATWNWDFGDASPASSATSPAHVYAVQGSYNATLIVTNAQGCTDTITYPVLVHPNPVSAFTTDTVCHTYATIYTDNSASAISWQWNFGDNSPVNTTQSPSYTFSSPGTYTTSLVVANVFGCTDTSSQQVVVLPQPQAGFVSTIVCATQPVTFTDTTTGVPNSWQWDFGDSSPANNTQNPTHSYTLGGTYPVTLIVGSGSGCSDTTQVAVTVNPIPAANFGFVSVCANDTMFFNSTSLGNPTTFAWDFGDATTDTTNDPTPAHVYAAGGTYSVTLTAGYSTGCTHSIVIPVTVYPRTVPSFSGTTPCLGFATNFSDSTANSPVTWQWNFGDSSPADTTQNPSHSYVNAGTYSVTLTTSNSFGCVDSVVANVVVRPLPVADFLADTVCEGAISSFTDISTSAVAWNWDFGDASPADSTQSPAHVYAAQGTYNATLIVTNIQGCTDTIVQPVIVRPNPVSLFTVSTACHTYATQFTDNSTAAVGWQWDFGDNSPQNTTQSPSYVYAAPGSYMSTLIVTNIYGCTDTSTKQVIVLVQPQAGFLSTTVCAAQAVTFTDTTTGAPNSWTWDFGDSSPIDTNQSPSHTYAVGGSYPITLIAGNSSGCIDTLVMNITVNTVPHPEFSATSVCLGNVTAFSDSSYDATPITNWYWDFGDGNNSFASNPTYIYQAPGVYNVTLTVTNATGCDSTFTLPVTVTGIPVAEFTYDTVCVGSATTFTDLSTGSPSSWLWDFGDSYTSTTGPVTTHTYATAGTYLVSLIASGGSGCIDQVFHIVTVSNTVQAALSVSNSVCLNDLVSFTDNSTATTGSVTSWNWDFGDGSPIDTTQNPTHIFPAPGNYTITLTVAGTTGCTSVATQNFTVNPLPVAAFSSTSACANQPTNFTDNSIGAVTDWLWNFGDNTSDTIQNPTHQYANSGTFNTTLIVTTAAGCSDTLVKPVVVYPKPVAAFRADTVCFGDTTQFTDLSTVGLGTIVSWDWDFSDGNTSTLTNPAHSFTIVNDSFLVTLVVQTADGCFDSLTQLVITNPIPDMHYAPLTASGCEDFTAQFYDSTLVAGGNIVNWLWDFGDGNYSYAQNPTHTYNDDGSYYVSLTVTSTDGCVFTDSLSYPVVVYPKPQAGFVASPPSTSVFTPNIDFIDQSQGAMYWEWDFGDFDGSLLQSPSHTYPDSGQYMVTQIVINPYGCRDTAIVPVWINAEYTYFVPNAFTPDGNGSNEVFLGLGIGVEVQDFQMLIFDRWGNLIFESKDPQKGWDGNLPSGAPAQIDAYVYKIHVKDVTGEDHTYIGHVNLVR